MRHIGMLPNEELARRFEDFMLVQEVRVRVDPEDGAWAVWVVEEDQLDRACEELARYEADSDAERYRGHGTHAHRTRKEEDRANRRFRKNQIDLRTAWSRSGGIPKAGPVTIVLIAVSVAFSLATSFGSDKNSLFYYFTFYSRDMVDQGPGWRGWEALLSGEIWRAFTPMFIHFGTIHLLFNMLWLHTLGSQMERKLKALPFLAFVLSVAAISSFSEHIWFHWRAEFGTVGGMSGVVYGLFGFIWIKSRFEPQDGYLLAPNTAMFMLIWMVVCMLGWVGNVANAAHLMGFVAGCGIGYWNTLQRKYFR